MSVAHFAFVYGESLRNALFAVKRDTVYYKNHDSAKCFTIHNTLITSLRWKSNCKWVFFAKFLSFFFHCRSYSVRVYSVNWKQNVMNSCRTVSSNCRPIVADTWPANVSPRSVSKRWPSVASNATCAPLCRSVIGRGGASWSALRHSSTCTAPKSSWKLPTTSWQRCEQNLRRLTPTGRH